MSLENVFKYENEPIPYSVEIYHTLVKLSNNEILFLLSGYKKPEKYAVIDLHKFISDEYLGKLIFNNDDYKFIYGISFLSKSLNQIIHCLFDFNFIRSKLDESDLKYFEEYLIDAQYISIDSEYIMIE